jgi:hypothetical protein
MRIVENIVVGWQEGLIGEKDRAVGKIWKGIESLQARSVNRQQTRFKILVHAKFDVLESFLKREKRSWND